MNPVKNMTLILVHRNEQIHFRVDIFSTGCWHCTFIITRFMGMYIYMDFSWIFQAFSLNKISLNEHYELSPEGNFPCFEITITVKLLFLLSVANFCLINKFVSVSWHHFDDDSSQSAFETYPNNVVFFFSYIL